MLNLETGLMIGLALVALGVIHGGLSRIMLHVYRHYPKEEPCGLSGQSC